jgi:hypothetical protein
MPKTTMPIDRVQGKKESRADKLASERRELQDRASEYLSSKPGRDNLSPNIALHSKLRRFLSGEPDLDYKQTWRLLKIVLYRLAQLQKADRYTQIMGLEMPSIMIFDIEEWERENMHTKGQDSELQDTAVNAYLWKVQREAQLFDSVRRGQGYHYYGKPIHYLAIALVENCRNFEEVKTKVSML